MTLDEITNSAETMTLSELKVWFKKMDFKFVESGQHKNVYVHSEYPDLVFKIYHSEGNWKSDSFHSLPEKIKFLYLGHLFNNTKLIIQPRANEVGGDSKKAYQSVLEQIKGLIGKPRLYDISEQNCRFHDGRAYLIDYASFKNEN